MLVQGPVAPGALSVFFGFLRVAVLMVEGMWLFEVFCGGKWFLRSIFVVTWVLVMFESRWCRVGWVWVERSL